MNMDLRNLPEPVDDGGPALALTQSIIFKVAMCIGLICMGIYYLMKGKRDGEVGSMVFGAILVIASFFLF